MSQTHTLTAVDYGVLANADAAADGRCRISPSASPEGREATKAALRHLHRLADEGYLAEVPVPHRPDFPVFALTETGRTALAARTAGSAAD